MVGDCASWHNINNDDKWSRQCLAKCVRCEGINRQFVVHVTASSIFVVSVARVCRFILYITNNYLCNVM